MKVDEENESLSVTVYYANGYGNAKNCLYPYSGTSSDPEELKALFGHDHTFIEFKDNYRCIDNFIKAIIAALDNDNDHSDNPNDWVYIPDIPKLFPGVPCIISTSRHHMKQKGDKGPRPRYHVMLLTNTITSPEEYTALLTKVQKHFPKKNPSTTSMVQMTEVSTKPAVLGLLRNPVWNCAISIWSLLR